jgi:hypothetical protein
MAFFGVTLLLLSACRSVDPGDAQMAPELETSVAQVLASPTATGGIPTIGHTPPAVPTPIGQTSSPAPTRIEPTLAGRPSPQGTPFLVAVTPRPTPDGPAPSQTVSATPVRAPASTAATPAVRSTPEPPDPRSEVSKKYGIWPEVWSQHAPGVASYEFKINCSGPGAVDDPCFLSDLTAVTVEMPDGRAFDLERDFNVNTYSGEVTRRWVLYGPNDGGLPPSGEYVFRYFRGGATVLEHPVRYAASIIDYPRDVAWTRAGKDLRVTWTPPAGLAPGVYYKVILWAEYGTPDTLVSLVFPWDARAGALPDVPLVEGGHYSLNVAIYFKDGYAYSEYVKLTW